MKQLVKVLFWFACIAVALLSLLTGEYLSSGAFDWWDKAQHALAFLVLCGDMSKCPKHFSMTVFDPIFKKSGVICLVYITKRSKKSVINNFHW